MQSAGGCRLTSACPRVPVTSRSSRELARVRAVPPQTAQFDLTQGGRGRLPAALDVSDPAGAYADLLQWTWDHAVRADWPRRKRKYEADIVSRTTVLSQRDWATAVCAIAQDVCWLGGGQLQITVQSHPPIDLGHAELVFIPSSLRDG